MSDNGERGKKIGMDRAERHADPHWWQCMLFSCRAVAERQPFFNTDDVVAYCRSNHPNASTHERRAIGPLMTEAAKRGFCQRTTSWTESTQAQCHRRPMWTWYSLIYPGHSRPPRNSKPLLVR